MHTMYKYSIPTIELSITYTTTKVIKLLALLFHFDDKYNYLFFYKLSINLHLNKLYARLFAEIITKQVVMA